MFKIEIKADKNQPQAELFATSVVQFFINECMHSMRKIERLPGRKAWKITDLDDTTGAVISVFLIGKSKHGGFVVIKEDHDMMRTKLKSYDFDELLRKFNTRYSTARTAVNTADLLWL